MVNEFEYDPIKSASNRDKHGIDFVEAQRLWSVPGFDQPLAFVLEPRWFRTARLDDRFWTAIYTLRGDTLRLISVRRARAGEILRHDQNIASGTGADQEP